MNFLKFDIYEPSLSKHQRYNLAETYNSIQIFRILGLKKQPTRPFEL